MRADIVPSGVSGHFLRLLALRMCAGHIRHSREGKDLHGDFIPAGRHQASGTQRRAREALAHGLQQRGDFELNQGARLGPAD